MVNKIFLVLKRIIIASLLIYSYDLLAVSARTSIPINVLTLSLVSIFGIPAMFGLVCLAFTF